MKTSILAIAIIFSINVSAEINNIVVFEGEDSTVQVNNSKAIYKVTFTGQFTKANHPVQSFPSNPHFSPLVVANHTPNYSMFPVGTIVTRGVKNVAETGKPNRLLSELKNSSFVESRAQGSSINGTGSSTITIEVSKDYPLISAISMIAPSPDWFVGVTLSLVKNNNFIKSRTISLYAMDAGTDKGRFFSSSNSPNRVKEPIHLLTDVSGISIGKPFGALIIEKQ